MIQSPEHNTTKIAEKLFTATKMTPQRRSMAYVYCNLIYFFGPIGRFNRISGLKRIQEENRHISRYLYNTYIDMMLRCGYLRSDSRGNIYITSFRTLFAPGGKRPPRRIAVDNRYILGPKRDFCDFCAYMTMVDAKRAFRRNKVRRGVERFTVLTNNAGAVYIDGKNRKCALEHGATSSQAMHITKKTIAKIAGVSQATASRIRKRAGRTGLLSVLTVLLPYTFEAHNYQGDKRAFMGEYVQTLCNRSADIRTMGDISANGFAFFRGEIANPKVGLNRIVRFGHAAYIQCPSLIVFDADAIAAPKK